MTGGQVTGGQWSGGQPDLSDCKSHGMSNLEVRVREEEQESVIAEALAELTKYVYDSDSYVSSLWMLLFSLYSTHMSF